LTERGVWAVLVVHTLFAWGVTAWAQHAERRDRDKSLEAWAARKGLKREPGESNRSLLTRMWRQP
jgi:hypothetical protein